MPDRPQFVAAGRPPLTRYCGGKFRLSKRIVAAMPAHVCYVEAFSGVAWVLFRKTRSRVEVLNDANGELVNLFLAVRDRPEELADMARFTLDSREYFDRLRRQDPALLNETERAFRYLYLAMNCFGGKLESPTWGYRASCSGKSYRASRVVELVKKAHARLEGVLIEHGDWRDILARYDRPGTFFFLDPPYMGTENYYPGGNFGQAGHAELARAVAGLKGKFLLTINDCAEARALYAGFHMSGVANSWSMNRGNRTGAVELFISNYKPPQQELL